MRGQTKPLPGAEIDWGHPLAQGLVGCWLMNEGAGVSVADYSAGGNHGILKGGARRSVAGIVMSANGHLIETTTMPMFSTNLTIGSAVARFRTTNSGVQHLCGTLNTAFAESFFRVAINFHPVSGANVKGATQCNIRSNSNNHLYAGFTSDSGCSDGRFHTLISTWDKASGVIAQYLDGVSLEMSYGFQLTGTSWIKWQHPLFISDTNKFGSPENVPLRGDYEMFGLYRRIITMEEARRYRPYAFIRTPTYRKFFIAGRGR